MREIKKVYFVAYKDKHFYEKNNNVILYLNSNKNSFNNLILNIYNLNRKIIFNKNFTINIKHSNESNTDFIKGYKYTSFIKFKLERINTSFDDLYIIELIYGKNFFYLDLIIKGTNKTSNLVLINNNTWNAYNYYHSLNFDKYTSIYKSRDLKNNKVFQHNYLSTQNECTLLNIFRPNIVTHTDLEYYINEFKIEKNGYCSVDIYSEILFLLFLKKHNIQYNLILDIELDNIFKNNDNKFNELIQQNKLLFIQSHPEYWSFSHLRFIYKFLNYKSNCVINLGGNVSFNKVCLNHQTNQIECHKDNKQYILRHKKEFISNKCNWKNDKSALKLIKRPQKILCNHYSFNSPNKKPYTILNKDHYLFKNIKLVDTIGHINMLGHSNEDGTCGWEMDSDLSKSFQKYVIAKRLDIRKNLGGSMICFDENKNKVFSGGSMIFCGSLLIDEKIEKLVLNVIQNFQDLDSI